MDSDEYYFVYVGQSREKLASMRDYISNIKWHIGPYMVARNILEISDREIPIIIRECSIAQNNSYPTYCCLTANEFNMYRIAFGGISNVSKNGPIYKELAEKMNG